MSTPRRKRVKCRFEAGLPAAGDMQLLFMQHAISKMKSDVGRAAIITNGSPLFSGNTTSGESQIRRYMLEHDLVEAIIALPSQLFYNTDIAIYAFILSKGKREERKGKIQLIDATDMWTPLGRSLGKKRREIPRDQAMLITEVYADFKKGKWTQWCEKRKCDCKIECKIFDKEEFLYKEWAVYQPLQRRGAINAECIERLRTSDYFTSNANLFNEAELAELEEINPRDSKAEKKYQKYKRGKVFIDAVLAALEGHQSDIVYMDFAKLLAAVKDIIRDIEGYSESRLNGIVMAMSVIDKSAVIQKDRKGKVLTVPTTKDSELIRLNQDVQGYFETEVLPHVPDAIWAYEFDSTRAVNAQNRERLGAEFLFTRYFYEYTEPEKATDLFARFLELERSVSAKISALQEGNA